MKITSIELAGSSRTTLRDGTPGLPRAFAKVSRTTDPEYIEVTIIRAGGERKHMVRADCEEDLWSMAKCLLHELEGVDGPNSAINDYCRELQRFAE
jgi:hypothetical protein